MRESHNPDLPEMEAAIKRMFAEMELADERIRKSQEEIDSLKLETRAILRTLKMR